MRTVYELGRLAARLQIKTAMATALPGAPPAPKPPPVPKPIPAAPPPMPVAPPPMPAAPPKMPVLGGSAAPPQPAPAAKPFRLTDSEVALIEQRTERREDDRDNAFFNRRAVGDRALMEAHWKQDDQRPDYIPEAQAEAVSLTEGLGVSNWKDLPADIRAKFNERHSAGMQASFIMQAEQQAQVRMLRAHNRAELARSKGLN